MTPGGDETRSERLRRRWREPEFRARMLDGMKAAKRERSRELRCMACRRGDCLLCDGEGCLCPCALDLDRKRRPMR